MYLGFYIRGYVVGIRVGREVAKQKKKSKPNQYCTMKPKQLAACTMPENDCKTYIHNQEG